MTNEINNTIKVNISNLTELFNIDTQVVQAMTINNTININELNGTHVISGAIDNGVCSSSCINNLHNFIDGIAITDNFLGNVADYQNVKLNNVNIANMIERESALIAINDKKSGNSIVTFWKATQNTQDGFKGSISNDNTVKLQNSFGLFFKIAIQDRELLGDCYFFDKIFANILSDYKNKDNTLIRFDNIVNRFYTDRSYVVEMSFSFLEEMRINESVLNRLKNFEASINTINTEV
jgi:hypothetical protein